LGGGRGGVEWGGVEWGGVEWGGGGSGGGVVWVSEGVGGSGAVNPDGCGVGWVGE